MSSRLEAKEKQLYVRVDEVLHYIWDPIGVAAVPQARDEYHMYLPQVLSLLKAGRSAEEIATYLDQIVSERMELPTSHQQSLEVALLLIEWQEAIEQSGAL